MPTRRIILHTIAYFIAVCLTTSRFAGAGPAVADEASARAFISAIYNSYNLTVRTRSGSTAVANYAAISNRRSPRR